MKDNISKNELSLMIEVSNKSAVNMEKIAYMLKSIADDSSYIKARLDDNRTFYPKEFCNTCDSRRKECNKNFENLSEDIEDINTGIITITKEVGGIKEGMSLRSLILKGSFTALGLAIAGLIKIIYDLSGIEK